MPLLVDGYESTRSSNHVFNSVLGRAFPDVTLAPASPRRGRLTALFDNESDAVLCEQMHTGTAVLTFADSDIPSAAMTYVADGSITRSLDPQSRTLWIVGIDFQEVEL